MPENCSCGTQLAEDALFCHRCGKAQRDLFPDADVVPEPPAPPLAPPPAAPSIALALPVNFSNTFAVRIGFLVASVASVLDAMPKLNLLCIIWSVCAGFVAVILYRRTTGQTLTIRGGAKIGWITGVLNSLIITVLTTIAVAANSKELNAAFREQVRVQAANDAATMSMIENPYVLATGIVFVLLIIFVIFTGACVAGGALGARITRNDRPPR